MIPSRPKSAPAPHGPLHCRVPPSLGTELPANPPSRLGCINLGEGSLGYLEDAAGLPVLASLARVRGAPGARRSCCPTSLLGVPRRKKWVCAPRRDYSPPLSSFLLSSILAPTECPMPPAPQEGPGTLARAALFLKAFSLTLNHLGLLS